MRVVKSVSVDDLELRGSIKDSDVAKLARGFAEDPHIHEPEAEALLRLNRSCPIQAPSWRGLLVDLIADYILNHSGPEGYITSEKSSWLIAKLSSDGWIANRAELDLLVSILGKARWFPLSLATFALEQVAGAAIHGFGPLRSGPGQASLPGTIGEQEIALLRTVLTAFGGDSALALTRPETEILLGINAAVAVRPVPPAWADFFAKAMSNVLLGEHGFAVPPRVVALRPGAGRAAAHPLDEQVALSLASLSRDYHRQSGEERALARLERQRIEIVTGEAILNDEPRWLTERLGAGSRLTQIEGAVLGHLSAAGLIRDLSLSIARDGKAA
jgi:hypothetical protein